LTGGFGEVKLQGRRQVADRWMEKEGSRVASVEPVRTES
jgi:hypothetical protein